MNRKLSSSKLEQIREFQPDWVLLNGNIHYETDVQSFLENLLPALVSSTRVVITYYSSLWKPLLRVATALRLRSQTPEENWIANEDVRNLLLLADYELIRHESKLLIPVYIPLISFIFREPISLRRSQAFAFSIFSISSLPALVSHLSTPTHDLRSRLSSRRETKREYRSRYFAHSCNGTGRRAYLCRG